MEFDGLCKILSEDPIKHLVDAHYIRNITDRLINAMLGLRAYQYFLTLICIFLNKKLVCIASVKVFRCRHIIIPVATSSPWRASLA